MADVKQFCVVNASLTPIQITPGFLIIVGDYGISNVVPVPAICWLLVEHWTVIHVSRTSGTLHNLTPIACAVNNANAPATAIRSQLAVTAALDNDLNSRATDVDITSMAKK